MSTPLRVVTNNPPAAQAPLSDRIRALQAEARGLAREHIEVLAASLLATQRLADDIAHGGDAYPPGVREIARRLSEDSAAKALTLEAISARV